MKFNIGFISLLCWTLSGPLLAADSTERARRIFEAGGGKVRMDETSSLVTSGGVGIDVRGPGVRFWYEHFVGGLLGSVEVSPDYRFCNGDRVALRLLGNRELQVLALGRSLSSASEPDAAGAGLGGGEAPAGDPPMDGAWRLLLTSGGHSVGVAPGETVSVPGEPWVLSDEAETLEVALIVSEEPVDLSGHFDVETGTALEAASASFESSGVRRSGSLDSSLAEWRRNAVLSRAQGGEIHSYGFQLATAGPAVIDVPLHHDPCFRRMTLPSRTSRAEGEE